MIDELSPDLLRELAHMMLGNRLRGYGMSRHVYDHPHDVSKVIKVENSRGHFQNVIEWEIWRTFQDDKIISKWLSPCHEISQNGTFLIMEKAFDVRPSEIPKRLPSFITDHKPDNFGVIGFGDNKRVVCRDYGTSSISLATNMRGWNK